MEDSLMVALRLAKEGYLGGDPIRILQYPADMVLAMVEYSGFLIDYRDTYMRLNEPSK